MYCIRRATSSSSPLRSASFLRSCRSVPRSITSSTGARNYSAASRANASILLSSSLSGNARQLTLPRKVDFVQYRNYADTVVKVPQMAESITEGTLKQWSKQVGDFVEQDEEIATIETDKIDVSVNAPEAGTIKEFLVNEEDTVTVGQDLVKIELGGEPSASSKAEAKEEPKEPAPKEQETSSQPEGGQEQAKEQSKQDEAPQPSNQESKPQQSPQEVKPAQQPTKPAPKEKDSDAKKESQPGNREERRVCERLSDHGHVTETCR
ncbi:single hybrid motif-containing protein [Aaosphaeria arxii CBS 175.79]|uniref:Single hybrid motif-containing protein n=1 Tax=Aaosphaeria arxii CBS 175.79 TaxID=1450172 RepID=A0A6A5XFF4_9PLEO|nr:single hybrid motif-containing protein [Aaosphaeria arxii CBS 175.79]KAF2011812.1 single hybrid motif-containing protein [Aaosphaeria arxii CBS 175.79]